MKNLKSYICELKILITLICVMTNIFLVFQTHAQVTFGTWSEWTSYNDLKKKTHILLANRANLHLAIRQDELTESEFESLISLLKLLKEQNIGFWLWPLLSKENGYWANQWNMDKYVKFTQNLISRIEKNGITPNGVSIDIEPPPEKLQLYLEYIQNGKFKKLRALSEKNINNTKYNLASLELKNLYQFLASKSIEAHVVTAPFILEGIKSEKLMRALGTPILEDTFDYISFMAYRSEFERLTGRINSRMIYRYAKLAKNAFGEKAGIDLGVVGNITFPHELRGYSNNERLWEDISAAKAAGITRMQVYCFDGMNSSDWMIEQKPNKPRASLKFFGVTRLIRMLLRSL